LSNEQVSELRTRAQQLKSVLQSKDPYNTKPDPITITIPPFLDFQMDPIVLDLCENNMVDDVRKKCRSVLNFLACISGMLITAKVFYKTVISM
jgi:hypothetical protein